VACASAPTTGSRSRATPRSCSPASRRSCAAVEVEIRADRFQAYVDGASVDLTRREFELIELLAGAEGRVLEREEIYQRVWGYAMARGDRSVDVFVRKLRQKLEKASPEWRYIHTHFGVGYRFSPEPAEGTAAAEAAAASAAPVDAAAAAAAGSAPAPAVGARARVTGGGRRASANPVDGDPPDADALVAHARSAVS